MERIENKISFASSSQNGEKYTRVSVEISLYEHNFPSEKTNELNDLFDEFAMKVDEKINKAVDENSTASELLPKNI